MKIVNLENDKEVDYLTLTTTDGHRYVISSSPIGLSVEILMHSSQITSFNGLILKPIAQNIVHIGADFVAFKF